MKKIIFFILFTIYASTTWGATYYVKTGGNDALDGLSDANAWGTLDKVYVERAGFSPGDSLLLKDDCVFSGKIVMASSGASSSHITISNYGNGTEQPIVNGISITGQSYIDISNITSIISSSIRGLSLSTSSYINIDNCIFDGNNSLATVSPNQFLCWISYCNNIIIENSIIKDAGRGEVLNTGAGISCFSVTDSIIKNNEIYNNYETNVQIMNSGAGTAESENITITGNTIYNPLPFDDNYETGINLGFGSKNCLVENNYVYNCRILLQFDAGTDGNIVKNNLFVNGKNDGIASHGLCVFRANNNGECNNNSAYHNTFISTNGYSYGVTMPSDNGIGGSGNKFNNNIIYTNTSNFTFVYANTDLINCGFDNNLYYSPSGILFSWNTTNYTTLSDWQLATSQDTHSIAADPLLSSRYRLLPGSPAINAGVDVGVDTDYLGNTRDGSPDIGCFESGNFIHNATIKNATFSN